MHLHRLYDCMVKNALKIGYGEGAISKWFEKICGDELPTLF